MSNPRQQLIDSYRELVRRKQTSGLIHTLYPEEGEYRRELYPKHMRFFALGKTKMGRLAMAGNGVGKTLGLGGYETALHLTGQYPDWWPGHRYTRAVRWWVAGKSIKTTRDYQQNVLLGRPNAEKRGNALIPTDCIDFDSLRRIQGGGGAIDYVRVRHINGGWSHLGFRCYDQDIDAFYGENLDGAWMDETSLRDLEIYSEIVARFRGSPHPLILVTFTPKRGSTPLVNLFTESEDDSRAVVSIDWDDVPHLDEKWKADTLANTDPHLRDTVKSGIPAMAEGAVYPVPEERFVIAPLVSIPSHWKRIAGFDGGWHNTAGVWIAHDPDSDTCYLYSEHKAGEMVPPLHATAMLARGKWIPFIGDARNTSQIDGAKMFKEYADCGVRIRKADKAVHAGISSVLTRLMTGRLKVYSTCTEWLKEYRAYRYKDSEPLKWNDHLMDATRYAIHGGLKYARTEMEARARELGPPMKEITFGRRY